jgi:chromosome segregation ATPase
MPDKDDRLADIPPISAARDEVDSYQRARQPGRRSEDRVAAKGSGGKGVVFLLILTWAVAGAAGWFFYEEFQRASGDLANAQQRIADLEGRLSSTDESMSQSSVAMQVRLKELDTEVRKLWDNVWKKSKARIETLESQAKKAETGLASQGKKVAALESAQKVFKSEVSAASKAVAGLKGAGDKLNEQQRLIVELRTKLQQISSELAALDKRVTENEGWNDSNLAYRKQVTRRLTELDKQLNSLLTGSQPN